MASSSASCSYFQLNPTFSPSSPLFSSGYRRTISLLNPFSSCNSHQLNHFGVSYSQPKRVITAPDSPSPFRVFSLVGSKATVVTGNSWEKSVLKSELPVLVEFYASWCGPCSMVHGVMEEIAAEYAGRVNCFILHADNELQIADEYDIKAVPVVLLFKNGEKCESVVGTMPKEFYVSAIEKVLASEN